jgi:hypothetical protein
MSPDRARRPVKKSPRGRKPPVKVGLSSDAHHRPVYFERSDGAAPARDFLLSSPPKVVSLIKSVVIAVASAPPKRFAGGGYWEAMHGEMHGWYEIRVDGPRRQVHYRLFCILDYEAHGEEKPLLVMVTGLTKPIGTTLKASDYADVRALGQEYLSSNPRSIT